MSSDAEVETSRALAERLNSDCQCISLDRAALSRELGQAPDGDALASMITLDRPHLFSGSTVFVSGEHVRHMAEIIAAIERVVAMPAYLAHVLAYAPPVARYQPRARGVFLGYDFHLGAAGPQLIEINSNAGGALLNALLARAQQACCDVVTARLPGMLGGVAALVVVDGIDFRAQLTGLLVTIAIAAIAGLFSGKVIVFLGRRLEPYTDAEEFEVEEGGTHLAPVTLDETSAILPGIALGEREAG